MIKRYKNFSRACLWLLVWGLSCQVMIADDESSSEDDEIVVVVSASSAYNEPNPLDVPQAIDVIDRKEIDQTVYKDVNSIVRELPNVEAGASVAQGEGKNRAANYWNEGFSIRGLSNRQVLVLGDGILQSGQGMGYGGGNLSLFNSYAIEKIEVVKGPGALAYGPGVIGGLVNIITREPMRRERAGVNGGMRMDFDSGWESLLVGGDVDFGNETFGVVLGSSYERALTPNLPGGEQANGGSFKRYGFFSKVDYYFTEQNRLRFFYNKTDNRNVSVLQEATIAGDAVFKFPYYKRQALGVELLVEEPSDSIVAFDCGVYWQQVKRSLDRTLPVVGDDIVVAPILPPWHPPVPSWNETFSAVQSSQVVTDDWSDTYEIRAQLQMDESPHNLLMGISLALDRVDSTENEETAVVGGVSLGGRRSQAGVGGCPANLGRAYTLAELESRGTILSAPSAGTVNRNTVDARQYRAGLYAQDTWDLYPVEVVFGGRFDAFHTKNDLAPYDKHDNAGVSGLLGFVYHRDEDTSFYTNVATAFREPDLSERYQTSVFSAGPNVHIQKGNPNLSSVRSYGAEVGTKKRHEYLSYEGAIFINQIDNYIGLEEVSRETSSGITEITKRYANVGGLLLYGAEAQVKVSPVEPWVIYASAARTYSANKDKLSPANWGFRYGTSYRMDVKDRYVQAIVPEVRGQTMLASQDVGNDVHFGGYSVYDAQITFLINSGKRVKGKAIIGVNNIFNRQYRIPFFDALQPGRGIFTSVQLAF